MPNHKKPLDQLQQRVNVCMTANHRVMLKLIGGAPTLRLLIENEYKKRMKALTNLNKD
jgi:hypothetical protein